MEIFILHYKEALGRAGKLKGLVTFTDGRTCRVWDDDLHAQCQELAREKITPVHYTHVTSVKWGHSLKSITRAAEYADAYQAAREADERLGSGVKPNSYLGRMIAHGNQAVSPEPSELGLDITQANAVPVDEHDELMKRVG